MKTKSLVQIFALSAFAFSIFTVPAAVWTGASLVPTNIWSDGNNWDTTTLPENQIVLFGNAASTSATNVVNNVLDTNLTIATFDYKAQVSSIVSITNYHTTLINPGITLTIQNGANPGSIINVGDVDTLEQDNQYYSTIIGEGASIVAGDISSPVDVQGLQSVATSRSNAAHIGVLDLSGLDNFSFAGGYVWVGASAANASGITDRPNGKLILARTNLIVAVSTATDGAIRVGESKGNTPPRESQLELGQVNTFHTTYMKIGGTKSGPSAGGRMYFRTSVTNNNPTFTLRGPDGIGRATTFGIADNASGAGSSIGSRGRVELANGTVDIFVDVANVGKTTSGTGTGAAAGTVTWNSGTFDVTTLNLGYQSGNTTGSATGTINVSGANGRLVAGSIVMGRDGGSATGRGIANLNITAGANAVVSGTIAENNATGGNSTSTINLTDGTLSVGDIVTVDTINLNNGTISNAALVTVTTLKGTGTIFGPVMVVSNFNPGLPAGTLSISNDLVLNPESSTVFEFNLDTLAADKVEGLGGVTFGGTLTLTNIAGTALASNTMAFQLFNATNYAGAFTATNLPSLGGGFTWDMSTLGTDGTVKLVSNVNTTPTNMVMQIVGNTLEFSWPSDHIGWRLQVQTNALAIGLNTNWVTLTGSDVTNRFVAPLSPTNESVFYRMIYP